MSKLSHATTRTMVAVDLVAQKAVVMRMVISSPVALTVQNRSAVIPRVTWVLNQATKPGPSSIK
jgi:hypothetical protein